jgi:hypothetical protein
MECEGSLLCLEEPATEALCNIHTMLVFMVRSITSFKNQGQFHTFGAPCKIRFGASEIGHICRKSQTEMRPNVHCTMFELPVNTKYKCHKNKKFREELICLLSTHISNLFEVPEPNLTALNLSEIYFNFIQFNLT